MTKARSLCAHFTRAIARLEEALALPKDTIVRDSAIQRFEISFELCWKFLKAFLEEQLNAVCTSPRTCFRAAFRHGVIDNDPFWVLAPVYGWVLFCPTATVMGATAESCGEYHCRLRRHPSG